MSTAGLIQGKPPGDPPGRGRSRTCIIIAGMHRSGTSAMARVVNLLGANITKDLAPAAPGLNDRGFWESNAIHPIHDRLLAQLASSWDDPLPLPDGWLETGAAQQAKSLIADEIHKDFSGSALFVVKDPRMARLLPLWLRILDELAIEPVVLIPFRNPLEIAASLGERDGFPFAKSMLLIIRSNLEAELASRGRTRFFHRYDDLVSNWRTFAARLATIDGLGGQAASAEPAAEIDRFLSAELHRHKSSRNDLASWPGVAATLVEVYDRMIEAADGDETLLRPAFDRLRATVDEATRLYRGLLAAEAESCRLAVVQVNGELEPRLEQRDARIMELNGQVRQRAVEIDLLRSELRLLGEELSEARRKAAQARDAYSVMLRSTTWRLTAPLRSIVHMTRKLLS